MTTEQLEEENYSNWKTNATIVCVFAILITIIWACGSYFFKEKPKPAPVQKTAIQILTDANVIFMQNIGTLSEEKKGLVQQRNNLDAQIKLRDNAILQYSEKIDANAQKISDFTTKN